MIKRINEFDKQWVCKINQRKFHLSIEYSFRILSHIGSFVFWLTIAFILYLLDIYDLSFWIYATCINGGIITLPIKLLIHRDRPFIANNVGCKIQLKDRFIISKHTSFPSGHSVYYSSCTIIVLLILESWWLIFLIIPLALIVGYSRINLGAHYPSDVIFGFIIGSTIVVLLTIILFPIYLPFFQYTSNLFKLFWHYFFP